MTTFRPGEFVKYRVATTIPIHLGQHERDLSLNEIVEYDGQTLKIGEETMQVANLRGAVKSGWLVPADDTTSVHRPQRTSRKVRPAVQNAGNKGNRNELPVVAEEDEREILSLEERRARNRPQEAQLVSETEGLAMLEVQEEDQKEIYRVEQPEPDYDVSKTRRARPIKVTRGADAPDPRNKVGVEVQDLLPDASVLNAAGSEDVLDVDIPEDVKALRDARRAQAGDASVAELTQPAPKAKKTTGKKTTKVASKTTKPKKIKWDKTKGSWEERYGRAMAKHGQDAAALSSIAGQETPKVKKLLRQHIATLEG